MSLGSKHICHCTLKKSLPVCCGPNFEDASVNVQCSTCLDKALLVRHVDNFALLPHATSLVSAVNTPLNPCRALLCMNDAYLCDVLCDLACIA